MLSSPEFWVAVAFVILVASVYRPMARGITGALDQQSAKIGASLDQATQLREEAQHLLAEYQRKQRNAETESEEIIAQARSQADRLAAEAAANLEAALKRREQAAIEKIAQAEAEAPRRGTRYRRRRRHRRDTFANAGTALSGLWPGADRSRHQGTSDKLH